MSIARVTEISSTSTVGFEDAIRKGVSRATQTLRNVRSAWVKEQQVTVRDNKIQSYRVDLKVTFVVDTSGSMDGDSIEQDLVRRDFTVNAMAVALPEKEFVDPHGGLEDLDGFVQGGDEHVDGPVGVTRGRDQGTEAAATKPTSPATSASRLSAGRSAALTRVKHT